MAEITASMVEELREKTDAPMMECKKALTEADGDMEKAEEILRVKLGTKASKAAVARRRRRRDRGRRRSGRQARRDGRSQLRNRLRRQERRLPRVRAGRWRSWSPSRTRPTSRRCRRCRCQDGFGRRSRTSRKGWSARSARTCRSAASQRYAGERQARQLPARRREIGVLVDVSAATTTVGQGCRDARRGDASRSALTADRGAGRADRASERRDRAPRRPREGRASRRSIVAKMVEGSVAEVPARKSRCSASPSSRDDKQTVEQMLKAQGRHASTASRCTSSARESRRRPTTSPPKSRRRWRRPRATELGCAAQRA